MAKSIYPSKNDLQAFIRELQRRRYAISQYLPPVSEEWYDLIGDCLTYIERTASYENLSFLEECSRILYKVAKRHELGDGNKRSSVIVLYLFCLLNDYMIIDPQAIKEQARRIARTKGRRNEELIRTRVAGSLANVIRYIP